MLDFEEFLIKWIKRKLNSNGSKIDGKIGVAVLNFGRKESLEDFKDLLFVIVVKIEHTESVVVLEELGKFGCALCSCLTIGGFEFFDGVGAERYQFGRYDERIAR